MALGRGNFAKLRGGRWVLGFLGLKVLLRVEGGGVEMARRRAGRRGFGLYQYVLPTFPGLRTGCDLVGLPCWEAELKRPPNSAWDLGMSGFPKRSLWNDQ
ncbi:hypothetical protein I79_021908 [Cricetulus griseus]|uniref:Uncharacterized protein n=1 Tax=Cricetulus griseus TaxID=10029 RepID=G3IDX0_CRIGR|nr:hypothetical protein I79_021908 [Cricetulus griseus]